MKDINREGDIAHVSCESCCKWFLQDGDILKRSEKEDRRDCTPERGIAVIGLVAFGGDGAEGFIT